MIDTVSLAKKMRRHLVEMTHHANSSHIGSGLSITDLVAVLYGAVLQIDSKNPQKKERDRFILSKGHAGAAVYAALAETGFFDSSLLQTYCDNGSCLSGHVFHKGVPGIEFSTGSLGHGLPVGAGIAYGLRLDHLSNRVFVLLSDGECDEGSNWEAILFSGHHQLDHLVAIVDYNKLQSLAAVSETLGLEPFAEKWRAFGWAVVEVDGHDHSELLKTFQALPVQQGKPTCVIAHTTKGKGISFMEHKVLWHYRAPQGDNYVQALKELGGE
ncbi:MAG: transketolase [Pseudomonadota bacterium]|nr:transketolase [Gammaproteobacteria bacterium]MBU1558938.1 transketolase [Gammaproteobacteria bacterium]MBU1927307.1 transketolase [Gammaproteobacteria bacterium]MBU2546208.1 transketolase [Gammaproteobacteria bacterium]